MWMIWRVEEQIAGDLDSFETFCLSACLESHRCRRETGRIYECGMCVHCHVYCRYCWVAGRVPLEGGRWQKDFELRKRSRRHVPHCSCCLPRLHHRDLARLKQIPALDASAPAPVGSPFASLNPMESVQRDRERETSSFTQKPRKFFMVHTLDRERAPETVTRVIIRPFQCRIRKKQMSTVPNN